MFDVDVDEDITYATAAGTRLTLDLYRPRAASHAPAVVYLHGGGFQAGDKRDGAAERLAPLARHGVAVASINYRLAPDSHYPAPLHDARAAVRWVRANGAQWGLDPARIGLWGASAGGYLAALASLTASDPALDGGVGEHADQSSSVGGVVVWFAPSDPVANSARTWLEQLICAPPAEHALFGGQFTADDERVRAATPLRRVHPQAPPFLIAHGDRDRVVAEQQSRMLHDALTHNGVQSTLCVLGGAGHEDPAFDTPANLALTAAWLRAQL